MIIVGVDDFAATGRPAWGGFDAGSAGETMSAAIKAADVKLGVAILAESARDTVAIGGECRAGIGAGIFDNSVAGTGGKIDEIDVGVSGLVTRIGEEAAIRGEAWANGDRIVMGKLLDVRPITIRNVDFLATGARGAESDAGAGDAAITGEGLDDIICKGVGSCAGIAVISAGDRGAAAMIADFAIELRAAGGASGDEGGAAGAGDVK